LVTFFDFKLSLGSVATYCRWGGNLCNVYIENLLTNHLVKELWKSVHICQSYYQTSSGLVFFRKRSRKSLILALLFLHSPEAAIRAAFSD